jgi:hypothetical protein
LRDANSAYNYNLLNGFAIEARQPNYDKTVTNFGPSGVEAMPMAAGTNIGGHSTWHYFSLFLSSSSKVLSFLPERRQLGFQHFAWAPTSQKY